MLQQRTWARIAAGGCCGSAGGYPTLYQFAAAHLGTYSAAGGCK